jgi:cytochrome c
LTVRLSAAGSKDHEGDALSYTWKLISGAAKDGRTVATTAEATITIAEPGTYRAELTVSDAKGASRTVSVPVMVGNSAPVVRFATPRDGDFFTPGKPVAYALEVTDHEDGSSREKAGEFAARTLVSSSVRGADGKGQPADPGFALMKASDCFNCHAVEHRIIGPSFLEIADRYRGQPGALDVSVTRVRAGSSKVWGEVPMLPHPQHSVDEVNLMLRWVFALEKGKGGPALVRGLSGEITAPKDDKAGLFILEATYADAGRAPAGSLSGKASVTLRTRRLEAEHGDVQGPKRMGKFIGAIDHGHHVSFSGIDLASVGGFTVRASSGNVGGIIELRAGSPTGDLLAAIPVPNTGGWDKFIEKSARLAQPRDDRSDVYVVFVNPGKGGLMNLDWVRFEPR